MKAVLLVVVFLFGGCGVTQFGEKSKKKNKETPDGEVDSDFTHSHLPIVMVDASEDVWIDKKVPAKIYVFDRGDNDISEYPSSVHDVGIKVRGQTSKDFAKNQYSVEMRDENDEDTDVSFLGMPAHEDWILHAPYSDKTLMRNHLAFTLWEKMGHYAVRRRYVEVHMRESSDRDFGYLGVYLGMEKISKGDDRLDVGKTSDEEEDDVEDVGGFIIKIDKVKSGDVPFKTPGGIRAQYVSPKADKIERNEAKNIKFYLHEFEKALDSGDFARVRALVDVESFADFMILRDFASDADSYWASTFFHKKKKGLLKAGAVWDFNIAFGNNDNEDWASASKIPGHRGWFEKLMKFPEFRELRLARWQEYRASFMSQQAIETLIDRTVEGLGEAVDRNYQAWNVLGQRLPFNTEDIPGTYEGEIENLKNWTRERGEFFESYMN